MEDILEEERLEVEIGLIVHRIFEYRRRFQELLSRYCVQTPEEIKQKIASKELNGHPAYEDYLDAISYYLEISTYLEQLEEKVKDIRGLG